MLFSTFRFLFFVFKQKTAYEMRISDWSSDVCSSDLNHLLRAADDPRPMLHLFQGGQGLIQAGDRVRVLQISVGHAVSRFFANAPHRTGKAFQASIYALRA